MEDPVLTWSWCNPSSSSVAPRALHVTSSLSQLFILRIVCERGKGGWRRWRRTKNENVLPKESKFFHPFVSLGQAPNKGFQRWTRNRGKEILSEMHSFLKIQMLDPTFTFVFRVSLKVQQQDAAKKERERKGIHLKPIIYTVVISQVTQSMENE